MESMFATSHSLYSFLDPAKKEIRVLLVAKCADTDSDSNAVHCTMSTVSLDDEPDYIALSYVWGDEDNREDIFINQQTVSVTRNLSCALRAVRDDSELGADEVLTIWADAVCINQQDAQEKMHQIALMGDIYKEATSVAAWIGEESDNSDRAIRELRKLAIVFCHHYRHNRLRQMGLHFLQVTLAKVGEKHKLPAWLMGWQRYWVQGWMKRMPPPSPEGLPGTTVDSEDQPNWSADTRNAVDALLTRPYWYRVWTFQELALAKDIVILCGSKRMPWTTLFFADRFGRVFEVSPFVTKSDNLPLLYIAHSMVQNFRRLRGVFAMRESLNMGRQVSLVEATEHVLNRQATHDIDRVYGCLGVVTSCDVIADYTVPVRDLYRRVMVMRFEEAGIFDDVASRNPEDDEKYAIKQKSLIDYRTEVVPLLMAGTAIQKRSDLPSWVHDLGFGYRMERAPLHCHATRNTVLRCSGASVKDDSFFLRAKEVGQVRRTWPVEIRTITNQLRIIIPAWLRDTGLPCPRDDKIFVMIREVLFVGYGDTTGRLRKRRLEPGSAEDAASIRAFLHYMTLMFKPWAEHPVGKRLLELVDAAIARLPAENRGPPEQVMGPRAFLRFDLAQTSLAYTAEGAFVSAGEGVQPGDKLFLAAGHPCPLIMRRCQEHYTYIGWAYVHGMMNAELLPDDVEEWSKSLETIEIR